MSDSAKMMALEYAQEARRMGVKPESVYRTISRSAMPSPPSWRLLGLERQVHQARLKRFYRDNGIHDQDCLYNFGVSTYPVKVAPGKLWFFEVTPIVGDLSRRDFGVDDDGNIHGVRVYRNGVIVDKGEQPFDELEWLFTDDAHAHRMERLKRLGAEFGDDLMPFNPAIYSEQDQRDAKMGQTDLGEVFKEHQKKASNILP